MAMASTTIAASSSPGAAKRGAGEDGSREGRRDLKQSGENQGRSAEAQEIAEAEGQLGGRGQQGRAGKRRRRRAAGKEKPAAPMISGRAEK